MNGKFIGVVIGAVVSIMLVGSLLVPIIDNATSGTGTETINGSPTTYEYDESVPADFGTLTLSLNNGVVTIQHNSTTMTFNGADIVKIPLVILEGEYWPGGDDNLFKQAIYYDNGSLIYYDYYMNNVLPFIDDVVISDTVDMDGVLHTSYLFTEGEPSEADITSIDFMVIPNPDSDYELFSQSYPGSESDIIKSIPFRGTTVWILAPPAVIDNGPDYSTIYATIPIILLVSLLVAVAAVAFKKQY